MCLLRNFCARYSRCFKSSHVPLELTSAGSFTFSAGYRQLKSGVHIWSKRWLLNFCKGYWLIFHLGMLCSSIPSPIDKKQIKMLVHNNIRGAGMEYDCFALKLIADWQEIHTSEYIYNHLQLDIQLYNDIFSWQI